MKYTLTFPLLVAAALAVSGCSFLEGSDVSSKSPTTGADVDVDVDVAKDGSTTGGSTTGGSTTTASGSLSAQAQNGVARQLDEGVQRFSNTLEIDGETGTVSADVVEGAGVSLIEYQLGTDDPKFILEAKANANTTLPTGEYNGPFSMSYREASGGQKSADGRIGISLNTEFNEALIGGIGSNDERNIEIFGDGVVADGAFAAPRSVIRMRTKSGEFMEDYDANVNGVLIDGAKSGVISGLVAVDDKGLKLNGGFTATPFE